MIALVAFKNALSSSYRVFHYSVIETASDRKHSKNVSYNDYQDNH